MEGYARRHTLFYGHGPCRRQVPRHGFLYLFFRNRHKPLPKNAIGSTVLLRVVESKPRGKVFIESILEMEPDSAGIEFLETPEPAVRRPESSRRDDSERRSQDPLSLPIRLGEELDMTPDDVNTISWMRLLKPMDELDPNEVQLLVENLEGHKLARVKERRAAS